MRNGSVFCTVFFYIVVVDWKTSKFSQNWLNLKYFSGIGNLILWRNSCGLFALWGLANIPDWRSQFLRGWPEEITRFVSILSNVESLNVRNWKLTTGRGNHLVQQFWAGAFPDLLDHCSQLFIGSVYVTCEHRALNVRIFWQCLTSIAPETSRCLWNVIFGSYILLPLSVSKMEKFVAMHCLINGTNIVWSLEQFVEHTFGVDPEWGSD